MIVFDVDQTLRDNTGSEHMVPEDMSIAENWLPWTDYVSIHSKPIERIVWLYEMFIKQRREVFVVTSSQRGIEEWLDRNGISRPSQLVTRDVGNNKSPSAFKKQWVDQHRDQIELWVDDDPRLCDYVRNLDIDVLQIWLPDGHPLKKGFSNEDK